MAGAAAPAGLEGGEGRGSIEGWLREARAARRRAQPLAPQLLRAMIRHDGYVCVPSEMSASIASGSAGRVWLAGSAGAPDMLSIIGLELAHALPPDLPALHVYFDEHGPLVLEECEVVELRLFLRVSVVEALLRRLYLGAELEVDEPFAALRSFESFYILCVHERGSVESEEDLNAGNLRMALVPDPEGSRCLAASFTARDSLQAFIAAHSHMRDSEQILAVRLSGLELFQKLKRQDGLHGIVFNPAGPEAPIAFAKTVADIILEEA